MNSTIRNQIPGTIKSIQQGDILSEVILETAVGEIAAIVTSGSVISLRLKDGDEVCAQIKATNISLCKCSCGNHH